RDKTTRSGCLLAGGALTFDLNGRALGGKSLLARAGFDRGRDAAIRQFGHAAATTADQELIAVHLGRMGAADEGIAGFDAMDQPLLDQKFERTIDRRRLRAAPLRP